MYGPQKRAAPDDVAALEAALTRWADLVETTVEPPDTPDFRDKDGAGAAGGVGFAALAVLNATQRPGIDLVLDLVRFTDHLAGARLVITGEGSLDEQTLHGKAPAGVAAAAAAAGVPVATVSGRLALTDQALHAAGIRQAYALTHLEPDIQRCIRDAGPFMEQLAQQIARDWLTPPTRSRAAHHTD